jgi:hypothetical protein
LRPGFSPALLPEFSSMDSRLQIAPMRIEKRPSDEKPVQLAIVKTEMKKMAQTRGKKSKCESGKKKVLPNQEKKIN